MTKPDTATAASDATAQDLEGIDSIDRQWMQLALELADHAAQLGEVPVGAVVVKDGHVIGRGYNQPISSSDPTGHAEIVALRQAAQQLSNYRLPGASLYVTVEPCAMCAGAIVHARVERVVFGTAEPKAGAVCSHLQLFDQAQLNHRVTWQGGVMAAEAKAQIQSFFARRREEKKRHKQAD